MEQLILLLILVPLAGFFLSLLFKNYQEKMISNIAIGFAGAELLLSIVAWAGWFAGGKEFHFVHLVTIYKSKDIDFGIDLFYDMVSGVYLMVSALLMFIVMVFSKYYMHRESGFKRYFNHAYLFYIGLLIVILGGNFETLFLGWEIAGVTSFLLIAFYRERYLPVRNGMKVLSFYRIGDVALIGAIWFSHQLVHGHVNFAHLPAIDHLDIEDSFQSIYALLVAWLFVQAAAVKSAQFPFSSWLPRAMEGPTVSSAIFYGSLSVHLGIFLLLRTYPFWSPIGIAQAAVIGIGAITAILASLTAAVQPTAKTQIAYSSMAQIGLMFIEIGLGWHVLALIHFAGNAFLRTYQILVSPSLLSYLTHRQIFHYNPKDRTALSFLPARVYNTLYMFSVKEWDLDFLWFQYIWRPAKKLGKRLHILRNPIAVGFVNLLLLVGVIHYLVYPLTGFHKFLLVSWGYASIALILVLIAWTERRSALRAWLFLCLSQIFFMLSIIQQHAFDSLQILIYLSGISGAIIGGTWALFRVATKENSINLNEFHGHVYEHPRFALLFLVSALTMAGFPISPTFIGFEIMFSEIQLSNRLLLVLSSLTFVLAEIAVVRIYARVFLGQHIKTYHETAFRSS